MRIAARVHALEKKIGEPQLRAEAARSAARSIIDALPLMDEAEGLEHEPLTDSEATALHDACRRAVGLRAIGTPP